MAVIQQANSYKTVIGWYGDCNDDECQDINLSTFKSQITSVYQWDNSGALKVWKSNLPDTLNRAFKTLECGKLYYLYVKPGTGSFSIPNFVVSSYETDDAGRIASSCVPPVVEETPTPEQPTPTPEQPTPTPTPEVPGECCTSSMSTFNTNGENTEEEYAVVFTGEALKVTVLKYKMWQDGGKLCVDMTDLEDVSSPDSFAVYRYYSLPSAPTQAIGLLARTYDNNKNTFYYTIGDDCYVAEYGDDGKDWQNPVVMTKTSGTAQPAPTYTLSANPTTPAEGNNISVILNTENVENGTLVPYTITGVGSSDITIPLTGNFTISGGGDTKFIGIVADQVTEGNETLTLKLNNNQAEVSVIIQDTSLSPQKPDEVEFRWNTMIVPGLGEREVLQVKNVLKPTHSNFASQNMSGWSTVFGYTGNDGAYSLNDAFWPDVAVPSDYMNFYSAITFDGMTIGLGAEETDSTIGKYKQLSISLKDGVEFSHDSNETSPSYLFMYKENINSENTSLGASGVWPVIVKEVVDSDDPTPTPADCSCIPDGYFSADITSEAMVSVAGQIFAGFQKGTQVGYNASSLASDLGSSVFFKYASGEDAGFVAISGGKPNNTKFYYKEGTKCYSVTVGASNLVGTDYIATWDLEDTLADSCGDASFADEYNCCTDYDTKINIINGTGEMLNGVQVTAFPDGRMDGNICFNAPGGYNIDLRAHIISFEGIDGDEFKVKLDLSIDYTNLKFIYRLKTGECYEGYLNNTYNSTFTEVT